MKIKLSIAIIGVLFSQQVEAARLPGTEARTAFRHAVEEYQIFVVPHCAPQQVETYVTARADRDRSFIQSLRNTKLLSDYKSAVKRSAKQNANTVFLCHLPPPPPPRTASSQPISDNIAMNALSEHFAAGDHQFAIMMRLRNAALGDSDD